jgi:PAS domain S-box-containing protein
MNVYLPNAIEGIFQTSAEGQYLDANPALARIYGYPTPAALIEGITDIQWQLYGDPTRRDEFVRLMQAQDVVEGFESRIVRKDGSEVWISERVAPSTTRKDACATTKGPGWTPCSARWRKNGCATMPRTTS